MISKCLLETEGTHITFELEKATEQQFNLAIQFALDAHLGGFSLNSPPTFITTSDIQRLIAYFEQHIAHLQTNPDHESQTFVPMELGFQLQALAGELYPDDDGEFTLRFMINVGKSSAEETAIYVGSETVVMLAHVRQFMAELEGAKSRTPYASPAYATTNGHYTLSNLLPFSRSDKLR